MELLEKLLILPEAIEKDKKVKREVSDPNPELLTGQQRHIYDNVLEILGSTTKHFALIRGYAGTGKTFLTSMMVEWMLHNRRSKNMVMTAPTNKAVKVMRDAADYQNVNLNYATVHSMLGLKEKIDGYGNQTFVQYSKDDASVDQYDVIWIDEVSMLPDDLFDMIMDYTHFLPLKIIFIGDPAQIPPIGKVDSKPFDPKVQKQYGIEVFDLTDIVRQAAGNPIINTTMKIRKFRNRSVVLPVKEDDYDPETMDGVYFFNGDRREEFYAILRTYFTSENFRLDANFMKIVAWTNKAVNTMNNTIRTMLHGSRPPRLCIGEKLIANKPILDLEEQVIFSNNDEFEVLSFETKSINYKGFDLNYYDTKVVQQTAFGDVFKTVKIVHDSSMADFDLILKYYSELAKAEKKGSWEAAKHWQSYFRIQNVFADVSYNYAITAHKSQGSTYQNCMVMELDIDANRKIEERNRIKYTAASRPVHKLFFIHD